jgi:ATP-dependent DNA helicase RecG
VPGVGPARAALLERLGVATVGDLLSLLPRRYEDRRRLSTIAALLPGAPATFLARVASAGAAVSPRRRRRLFRAVLEDETGSVEALWFRFRPGHLVPLLAPGARVLVHGALSGGGAKREILHPEVEPAGEEGGRGGPAVRPVYPATAGISQGVLRAVVRRALEAALPEIGDPLPSELRGRLGLPGLAESLRAVHAPADDAPLELIATARSPWHRRLAFDELLGLQLRLAAERRLFGGGAPPPRSVPAAGERLLERLRERLPFALTAAQERVCREILRDMAGPAPMQRLLQGDVGSGKTVVAVLAALCAAGAGGQAALMAPTEILAEQHALTIAGIAGALGLRTALLTGGTPRERRAAVLAGLAAGSVGLVVGTHALLEESVRFRRLALAVVDEQQRFGVRQRLRLRGKGAAPHLLVMSATPIPRSLALTLYGDLDLSVIDELPPGRRPVETRVAGEASRRGVWEEVRAELARGRRAFVVCPRVDEDADDGRAAERTAATLAREVFPGTPVGLLHGGMPLEERARALARFRSGEAPLLVATSVVEVGIDVPEASAVVVLRAELFGLAQLHQIRGRVGRGSAPGRCWLLTGPRPGPEARERLALLERSGDGFAIAEADLRLRGPGEVAGTRQSGLAALRIADLSRDRALVALAREEARRIVASDPGLERPEHAGLRTLAGHGAGGPAAARGAG